MITVAAGLLEKEGRVLIGKRKAGKPWPGLWEFPGGKVEPGELPERCVAREFREELNIEIQVGPPAAQNVYEYPSGAVRLYLYWVRWVSGEMKMLDHEELAWALPGDLASYDFLEGNRSILSMVTARFGAG